MPQFPAQVRLFSTDPYPITLPEGHKFPVRKYGLLRSAIETQGKFHLQTAPFADVATLELAHDAAYVRDFVQGRLPPSAMRRIGLPWSELLVKRALASVGGTLSAALDALSFGWGGTVGGGTHHALHADGAGFCVFNDIAVAIRFLLASGKIRRAAVIDLDVHQGDGTAEIFSAHPDVFTLSIHCQSNFPFRKQRSTLDIGLPDATGDSEYLAQLDAVLPNVFDFQPDIIFYQSGVDGLSTDALGRLALTPQGLIERDRRVFLQALSRGVPLVLTSGGGYSNPIELSVAAHANTYRTASEVYFGS